MSRVLIKDELRGVDPVEVIGYSHKEDRQNSYDRKRAYKEKSNARRNSAKSRSSAHASRKFRNMMEDEDYDF